MKCLFIGGPLHGHLKPVDKMRRYYEHGDTTYELFSIETAPSADGHSVTPGERWPLFVTGPMPPAAVVLELIRKRRAPSIPPAVPMEAANDH